jgi:hypothetical protein
MPPLHRLDHLRLVQPAAAPPRSECLQEHLLALDRCLVHISDIEKGPHVRQLPDPPPPSRKQLVLPPVPSDLQVHDPYSDRPCYPAQLPLPALDLPPATCFFSPGHLLLQVVFFFSRLLPSRLHQTRTSPIWTQAAACLPLVWPTTDTRSCQKHPYPGCCCKTLAGTSRLRHRRRQLPERQALSHMRDQPSK